jgi:hypothetical protein
MAHVDVVGALKKKENPQKSEVTQAPTLEC